MNSARIYLIVFTLAVSSPAFAGKPGKPKGKPRKKVAPSLTVKDLAVREARACDTNHNGKIDPSEMSLVRAAQSKNPKSYLYLFDENNNRYLDDSELSKIRFAPGKPAGQKKK